MKHLYLFALLLFFQTPSFAKHIIGGVLTYECLGGGTYRFTMKMYRDCSDPTGADFDNPAPFTIYKGDDQDPLTTLFINYQSVTPVDQPDNPCFEELPPSVVCVQEGVYVFEYTFDDWPSDEPYHISYQRCCRNAGVTNLVNPDDVGATFTVEITPASQSFCNNSPVFNTFPPIVLCVGEPLSYDHSAFDQEGDQLVYSFCSPLVGGAPPGGGGGGGPCAVVAPNPACPPPYDEAAFVNPPYSPLNPMGGNPVVSIDPVSGLLSGTPVLEGQFVVAVCVQEYRNGILLSEIRRDFQFNVTECDPQLSASISSPNIVEINGEFYMETCNGLDIFIENESSVMGNVDTFYWQFVTPDTTLYYDGWDLDMTFPGQGSYEGSLILNPGADCGDTASVRINIYPEIIAEFTYDYDTCFAGPVTFLNESYIDGPGEISNLFWNLGDGTVDSLANNPVHLYAEPDVLPVTLEVWDTNGCMAEVMETVVYKPVPSLILVRPNDTTSCPPANIFFSNLSSPIDETYDIFWDFGDGKTSSAISPFHVYEEAGVYDVRLQITSPIGCESDTTFVGLIELLDPPVARFEIDPPVANNFEPEVEFIDQSVDAVHWEWLVNGELVALQQNLAYSFQDTGIQEVTLVVTHPEKCQDTTSLLIDVEPHVTYFLPNAFTPNEDTTNDYFKGTGVTRGVTNFKMEIWDRWGKKIYESDNLEESWNGRMNNNGRQVQAGVYVCVVTFTGPRGEPFEQKGYVTLMR